jgi:hypothetical protein
MHRIIQSCKCNSIIVQAQSNVTIKSWATYPIDEVSTTSLSQQMIGLQQNMLKTLWVSLSVKTQTIYVIHSAQPTKHHDATIPLNTTNTQSRQ